MIDVRIRKEKWGYVLFDKLTRRHHFLRTEESLNQLDTEELRSRLTELFDAAPDQISWEFLNVSSSNFELVAPIGMYMEISDHCNLNCGHCYKPDISSSVPLTTDQIKRVILDLRNMGAFEVRFCGNEPTVHPDFFDIIQYARDQSFYVGVNTNACFSDDFGDSLIVNPPHFFAVSLDGTETTHDTIRRQGSYRQVRMFLDKLSSTSIPRRVNMLVSPATIFDMEHVADIATSAGCGVSFLPFRHIGRETRFKREDKMDKNWMLKAVHKTMELRAKHPQFTFLTYFDVFTETPIYHHSMDFNIPCPAAKNGFITCTGDYYPCDFLRYLGTKWLCGNVVSENISEIWSDSSILRDFRHIEHVKCKNCAHYMTRCYGGCISGAIASSENPDDELCFVDIG